MTPTPQFPARLPTALRSVLREVSVAMTAGLLLSVMGVFAGCVGQRFEGEESAASSSQLVPAPSDVPSASAVAPVATPSLSAVSVASSAAPSAAGSDSAAPAASSAVPALDAGASPVDAGEPTPPPCPAWGCPLNECPDSSDMLSPYGVCYFIGGSAPWADARTACTGRGEGWSLLTIRSEEEHQFASGYLLFNATWLGASDQSRANYWTWLGDESPFFIGEAEQGTAQDGAFIQWSEGEPSNMGMGEQEQCARYELDPYGYWHWEAVFCNRYLDIICELRGD